MHTKIGIEFFKMAGQIAAKSKNSSVLNNDTIFKIKRAFSIIKLNNFIRLRQIFKCTDKEKNVLPFSVRHDVVTRRSTLRFGPWGLE